MHTLTRPAVQPFVSGLTSCDANIDTSLQNVLSPIIDCETDPNWQQGNPTLGIKADLSDANLSAVIQGK